MCQAKGTHPPRGLCNTTPPLPCHDASVADEIPPLSPRRLSPATVAVIAGRPDAAGRAAEPAARPGVQRPRRGRVQPHPRHADVGRAGGRGRRARGRAGVVVLLRHGGRGGGRLRARRRGSSCSRPSATSACAACSPSTPPSGALELRPVDITDTAAVLAAANGADVVWVETPTNPTLDVADLAGITRRRRRRPAPDGRRLDVRHPAAPAAVGARCGRRACTAATKFIGGHSDLMIGLCVTADDAVHERLVAGPHVPGRDAGRARGVPRPARAAHAAGAAGGRRAQRGRARRAAARPSGRRRRRATRGPARWCRSSAAKARRRPMRCATTVRVLVPATSLGGVETTIERRQKYAGDSPRRPGAAAA